MHLTEKNCFVSKFETLKSNWCNISESHIKHRMIIFIAIGKVNQVKQSLQYLKG